jgi:hypothetical protein
VIRREAFSPPLLFFVRNSFQSILVMSSQANTRAPLLASCSLLFPAPMAHAQTQPQPPIPESDTVTLSPFVVNVDRDRGFVAASSVAGVLLGRHPDWADPDKPRASYLFASIRKTSCYHEENS